MTTILRRLLVAATVALATAGASAQSTSPTAQTSRNTEPTKAERDFEAAKAACQTQRSRTARLECLRHAEDSYNRATGVIAAPFSGAGGTASGTQQNGSARARS